MSLFDLLEFSKTQLSSKTMPCSWSPPLIFSGSLTSGSKNFKHQFTINIKFLYNDPEKTTDIIKREFGKLRGSL